MSEIISVLAPTWGEGAYVVLERYPDGRVEWTVDTALYDGVDSGTWKGEEAKENWAEALQRPDVRIYQGITWRQVPPR